MKKIMIRAWEIAKQGAAKFGGKAKEYFAEALRMAWKEAKTPVKVDFGDWRILETEWGDKMFRIWRKYGYNRLYVNRDDGKKTYGYINLDTMEFVSLRGVFSSDFGPAMIKAISDFAF